MVNSARDVIGFGPTCYQIKIIGEIRQNWSDWFSGMDISMEKVGEEAKVTTLIGVVTDQAALRGILCKIWDLNLTILSVARIEIKTGEKERNKNE